MCILVYLNYLKQSLNFIVRMSFPAYVYQYNIPFFDDIHNFFPDLLYAPLGRFNTAADILIYIREQVRLRGDRFSAAQRSMNNYYIPGAVPTVQPRVVQPPPVTVPLPVPPPPPPPAQPPVLRREIVNLEDMDFMNSLLNIFAQPAGTISILGTTLANNLSPVIVSPTNQQIADATTIIHAIHANPEQQCTICFETLRTGQTCRMINHCEHTFHQTCIDRWFATNVRCPNCRYDIRGEPEAEAEAEDEVNNYYEEEDTE